MMFIKKKTKRNHKNTIYQKTNILLEHPLMKTLIPILFLLILTSCSTTIDSTKNDIGKDKYDKPLIVVPYNHYTKVVNNRLINNLQYIMTSKKQLVSFKKFEVGKEGFDQNSNEYAVHLTNVLADVEKNSNDLIIFVSASFVSMHNFSIREIIYNVTALDPHINKEIWKAKVTSKNALGSNVDQQKTAETIINKLIFDKVLKGTQID
jgi:hypothetical protein